VALAFVSILLAYFGELAVILCAGIFARVCITVLGLLQGNFQCPWVSGLLLQFMHAHLHVHEVLQCIVFRACCSVLVIFSPSSSPLIIIIITIIVVLSPLNSQFSVMDA